MNKLFSKLRIFSRGDAESRSRAEKDEEEIHELAFLRASAPPREDSNNQLPSISPIAALPAFLAVILLIVPQFLPKQAMHEEMNMFVAALSTQTAFFIFAALSALCARTPLRVWFSLNRPGWGRFPMYVLEMFLAVILAAIVSGVLLKGLQVNAPPQPVFGWLEKQSRLQIATMATAVCLLAPVCEEFFFRGVCFNALRTRLGVNGGNVAAALIFALIHVNIFAFFPLFVMALFLTRAYAAIGSIWAPVAMHAIFNAASLVLWSLGVEGGL